MSKPPRYIGASLEYEVMMPLFLLRRMYVVQGGDTIDSIARLYRVDPAILAKDNGVATRAHLSAGSVLWAPGDKPPQIAAGQYPTTLTSVAAGLVVALSAWPSVVRAARNSTCHEAEVYLPPVL